MYVCTSIGPILHSCTAEYYVYGQRPTQQCNAMGPSFVVVIESKLNDDDALCCKCQFTDSMIKSSTPRHMSTQTLLPPISR